MVYLWEFPRKYPRKLIGLYDHDRSPNYLLFSEGKRLVKNELYGFDIQEIFEYPTLNIEATKKEILAYDCLGNNASIPLVNERLKKTLETLAPGDVQFFEAKLHCLDGELPGYYFFSATHEIKGIDFENSKYKKIPMPSDSFIYNFDYMTYKPNSMGDHLFARDADYHGNLLVREDAAKALEKAKFKGLYLVRPENFYRPITADDLTGGQAED